MDTKKFNLANSKLVLEGSAKKRDRWESKVNDYVRQLKKDQNERKKINEVRMDFFLGNQSSYTNIIGLQKKEKKGHANATFNYAGKTCVKLYYALANNPPKVKIPGLSVDTKNFTTEALRAQGVEDFVDTVFYMNRFFHSGYPRGSMNQIVTGAAAIMVYYEMETKTIKVVNKENMNELLVGWKGDNSTEYDFVIDTERLSVEAVEKEYGIKILKAGMVQDETDKTTQSGSHESGGEYGTREKTSTMSPVTPTGKTDLPKVTVAKYWDEDRNIILVNGTMIQYVEHEWGFNPYTIIPNIQVPNRAWGMSDIDFLIDPQIEYCGGR